MTNGAVMSEHTPTPWFADPDDRPGMWWNTHIVSEADRELRICFMTSDGPSQANAAFIVRAVNSHDALVKALEKIAGMGPERQLGSYCTYARDIARAALAGAKK